MSKRITHRERDRSAVNYTANLIPVATKFSKKPAFVRGSLSEVSGTDGTVQCGDGTEYSMLVTAYELFEILFGVREAWFTQGSLQETYASFDPYTYPTINALGVPSATNLVTIDQPSFADDNFNQRGYFTAESIDKIPTTLTGTAYTVADSGGFFGENVEDTTGDEMGLEWDGWYVKEVYPAIPFGTFGSNIVIPSGMNHVIGTIGVSNQNTSTWGEYSIYGKDEDLVNSVFGAEIVCFIKNTVAFIDTTGTGDPYDSGNSIYLGIHFEAAPDDGFGGRRISTNTQNLDSGDPTADSGANLVFELAKTSPTAKIYAQLSSAGSGSTGLANPVDYILKAQKWFEYATKSGDPAWDEDTGLPINGGPAG